MFLCLGVGPVCVYLCKILVRKTIFDELFWQQVHYDVADVPSITHVIWIIFLCFLL